MLKIGVMNKTLFLRNLLSGVSLSILFLLTGCGGGGKQDLGGELVGVPDREGWQQIVPYGMVVCPSGTFHMGQADQDVPATMINLNKQVTIGGFYMDETEITNNEYRQFVLVMLTDSSHLGEEYIMKELYPDTSVWVRNFSHHMGDPMMEYYFALKKAASQVYSYIESNLLHPHL